MDEELMCESLMKWLNTFETIKAPHSTADELTDGVALCECLAEIAPDWFDDELISKIRRDAKDNRRLKVNNLKKLLKGICDYYTEVLTMDIAGFPMPDISAIAENTDLIELSRLLQLILGCAVNCEDKQEYIQVIMSMEQSVQHVVMTAIQELMTAREAAGVDTEQYKELEQQHKKTLGQLSSIVAEKEELSQRCHELDEQLSFMKETESSLQLENERLRERLSYANKDGSSERDIGDSFSSKRLEQLQQDVQRLKEENFQLESARDEYKIKYETLERDALLINERNEQLQSLAEESQMLKDEMDILRHSQEKVAKYESTIEMYKKKLEELSDMRKQMKAMEEKNATYMQETMNLEEDLRKANMLKSQVDTYKKQVHQLQVQLSELQRRADKAEFEAKKSKEKLSTFEGENERLRAEIVTTREANEELQLNQVTGMIMPGSPPSPGDNLYALADVKSPEVKETLIRLQHENKKLKAQMKDEQEGQVIAVYDHTDFLPGAERVREQLEKLKNQLLQSLLNDTTERKDQLEKENRAMNKRIMELESEIDDLTNQEKAKKDEGEGVLHKKYTGHLDKLREANAELQKKKAYIDSLEPKAQSSAEKVNELQDMLSKKETEMKQMEDRYKRYLDKAKSVIKTLDPKQNASSPDVHALRNQLSEKEKIIEHLERDHEKMKITREREEKLIVSAWYEMGVQLHRKAAEERLSGSSGGMSFLARQRQASSRRTSTPSRSQSSTVSARDT